MNLPLGNRRLYAPYYEGHADPRRALGAFPRDPDMPDSACFYCAQLGPWIQATHYDHTGKPCCQVCAGNGNRRGM